MDQKPQMNLRDESNRAPFLTLPDRGESLSFLTTAFSHQRDGVKESQ